MSDTIFRRPRAKEDLLAIWSYIADDNEAAAERLLQRIDRSLQNLAKNPNIGRARPELLPDLRSFPVSNYIVFYLPSADGIDVVRVLSSYRDIQAEDMD